MQTEEQLKEIVRKKYTEIALQDKETNMSSCCGASGCSTEIYNIMSDDYTVLNGYNPDADLGLGCGLPTQFAKIKTGDVVVDLGSGAGNDCFIARHETGETGKVIGVDFTSAMIDKARTNAELRGFNNVEFRQGDIEHMPITSNTADVIVSNCVLNLVPNKNAVMKDIYRVLKPGGRVIVLEFSHPIDKVTEKVYDFYSFKLLPKIGKFVAKDEDSYRYLAESIRMHPKQDELKKMMENAGLERCEYFNMSQGIVAIHRGYKI